MRPSLRGGPFFCFSCPFTVSNVPVGVGVPVSGKSSFSTIKKHFVIYLVHLDSITNE